MLHPWDSRQHRCDSDGGRRIHFHIGGRNGYSGSPVLCDRGRTAVLERGNTAFKSAD